MTEVPEPQSERRYADPDAVVDEPIGPHLLMAASGVGGILVLMGLFALSTGNLIHGWGWALFAIPAGLLAVAGAAALHALDAR